MDGMKARSLKGDYDLERFIFNSAWLLRLFGWNIGSSIQFALGNHATYP
jgi:hypothetical protein